MAGERASTNPFGPDQATERDQWHEGWSRTEMDYVASISIAKKIVVAPQPDPVHTDDGYDWEPEPEPTPKRKRRGRRGSK